jgi:glycosyltransferase involved in cell wall biosynthesis
MPTLTPQPTISVVILVGALRHRAERCLSAVLDQSQPPLEVLVVDVDPASPPIAGSAHPAVRRIALPPATEFGPARARGVAEARGEVVAFLEEHTEPCPDWLAALARAFRHGWSGVGPCVLNGNPGVGFSDLTFALGYGLYLPPCDREPTPWLPSHNSAFRRDVLVGLGDRLPDLLASENVMRAVLWREGHRFAMEPDSQIRHWNEAWLRGTPALYFHFHRAGAAAEKRYLRDSRWRRRAMVLLWPAVPFYALWLLDRRMRRRPPAQRPIRRGEIAKRFPYLLAIHGVGAFGRALGSLGWAGDSHAGFTRLELTLPRDPGDLVASGS